MSETIDVQRYLERFLGEVPQGSAGDRMMRERVAVPFMDTTDDDVRLARLDADQVNSWLDYAAWNLWDFILGRASEGESGLIPRQEYETLAFVQQWSVYPAYVRSLTEELGVDGLVELAATSRREVGTKINVTRNWAASVCPLLGRGIAVELGLDQADSRREDLEGLIQFGRRLQHGTWGGGSGLVSGRGYQVKVLDDDVVGRLAAEVVELDDPEQLTAFRRFNANTELFGFMLHYDCRAGMADSGPYALPDGRFMIVRDHFLNESAYPWSGVAEGLPYCVTQAMVFRGGEVDISITDIMTTFSKPSNYLDSLVGAAVFARDEVDTPVERLRPLDRDAMTAITERCKRGTLDMYRTLARKSREEKIRDGIMVYTREFLMPHARRVGLWDRWVADGFDTLHPGTEAVWPTLTGGRAEEILTPVLLFGKGFPHVAADTGR